MEPESFLTLNRQQCKYPVQGSERYKDIVQLHCCLYKVRKLSDFIKSILICVPKMNKVLGVWKNTRVSN